MAAASKAYTTDDGKTSVKQDSSTASQMIAATTESPGKLLFKVSKIYTKPKLNRGPLAYWLTRQTVVLYTGLWIPVRSNSFSPCS